MNTLCLDRRILRDTHAQTNKERKGEWYYKVHFCDDYQLITGPQESYAKELAALWRAGYAREQMSEAQSNDYSEALNYEF